MKKTLLSLPLVLSLLAALALGGCASTDVQTEAAAPSAQRDLNRADAIASARQDASRSYGKGWDGHVNAHLAGGFWIVELHAATGYRLRYAISAHDGSIHERAMIQ